ncbi:MAG: phosphate ABC transporter permease subunit PstC [Planctomycetota bacterium]
MPSASTSSASAKVPGPEAAEPTVDKSKRWLWERAIHVALALCAFVSVATTIGIVAILVVEAGPFFLEVPITAFLFDTKWSPRLDHYGVLELFAGTLLVTVGAAAVAIPIGLGAAVYLSEYAKPAVREVVKPLLEVLAGIPSVVYGWVALTVVSPAIRGFAKWWSEATGWEVVVEGFNAISASVVVGFMILPMVVSLSEDVLRAVPRSLREAAFALGATKFDVTAKVVVPAAFSGIMASFLLAVARAIGETMAVTLAAGERPNLTLNPLEGVQTMTAYIVSTTQGDTETGSLEYSTVFAVGLALFFCTMAINLLAQWILERTRESYE